MAEPFSPFERMKAGMDRFDPARQRQFEAQRVMRGLGDIVFGVPDLVNMGVNAGLSGVDAASQSLGGPEIDYRFQMPSDVAADLVGQAAESAGVDVIDPASVPPEVQRRGDLARLITSVMPVGPEALAPAMKLGMAALPAARRSLFDLVPNDPAQLTPKGKDPEWFHAVGGKPKLQRPFSEMTATTEPTGPMTPTRQLDPQELQGGLLLPLYGDKTAAGQTLTHINDEALPRPQALQGGARFMQENPGQIWASEPGAPLSMLSRKARRLQEETGKPVYGVHVAMGPQGGDFARMTTRPLLDMAKEAPVKRADLRLFDEEMRGELGGVKGQRWPGLMKADDDWLAAASGNDRATLAKVMQLASHQSAGFPDVGSLRKAITDPDLVNRPMLTTGRTVGRFDPMATLSPSSHDTYGMGIAGDYVGDLGALPIDAVFQDFMKTRPPGEMLPLTGRTVSTQLPVQEADQQWLDSLMQRLGGRGR
jgi:hypothetical protein